MSVSPDEPGAAGNGRLRETDTCPCPPRPPRRWPLSIAELEALQALRRREAELLRSIARSRLVPEGTRFRLDAGAAGRPPALIEVVEGETDTCLSPDAEAPEGGEG